MNQQVGVESEKETQNVPAVGAWDVGEQLDYGWEPRGKGQGQGRTRKSIEFLPRGPESLCRAASGQLDRARQGQRPGVGGYKHSALQETIKVQLECSIFKTNEQ